MKRKDLNLKQVKYLVGKGWKLEEIAEFFGCTDRHLKQRFPRLFKPGRPRIPVDEKVVSQIRALAVLNCTDEEIAAVVGVSRGTFMTWKQRPDVAQALEFGRLEGNVSLRRRKWALAVKGNVTMLIWESKQRLGEKDKQEIEPVGEQRNVMLVPAPMDMAQWDKVAREYQETLVRNKPE